MSDTTGYTERTPLATVEAFEAAAFRAASVARRLLADHPDLPVRQIRPNASAYADTDSTFAQLEISTRSVDGVRAWAEVLGTTVTVHFHDARGSSTLAFEHHQAQAEVAGVEVAVVATRRDLTDDEFAAWRAKQAAAEDGEGR